MAVWGNLFPDSSLFRGEARCGAGFTHFEGTAASCCAPVPGALKRGQRPLPT